MSETKEKKFEFEALAQNDLGTEWGVYRGTEEWNSYRGREARAYALTEVRNLNRLLHESAAAPDLLAALAKIRDARDANAESNPPDIGNYTCFDDWAADVASAAVNLATESRP